MGPVTKNEPSDIETLLNFTNKALRNGWYIILSASSGLGWRNVSDSAVNQRIERYMTKFVTSLEPVISKMFTQEEAEAYMRSHNIDINKWESDLLHTTNGNPLLLSYFKYAIGNDNKFGFGHVCVQQFLRYLSYNVIDAMKSKVFITTMSKCHKWLVFAVQETPIPIEEKLEYMSSYVALEHLTYLKEQRGSTFVIEQSFPMFYEYLTKELVTRFDRGDTDVRNSPLVQGLVFESKFLQNEELHDVHIKGLNINGHKCFYFPSFPHARLQEDKPVTELSNGQLYHLRKGHPAIDAVCVAEDQQSGHMYLVLMQVSLSKYGEHKTKASDISKQIVGKEKAAAAHPDVSIVEYYREMTKAIAQDDKMIAEDHVLFVYASPKELNVPLESTFPDVLSRRGTRSGSHSPPYFYGFVEAGTHVAQLLRTLEQNVKTSN